MKERLTKKDKYGHWYTNSTVYDRGMTSEDGVHYEKHYFENGLSAYDGEPIDRLAEYEDAEEQGLIVRLPCKVGDKLLYVNPYLDEPRIEEYRVEIFEICIYNRLRIWVTETSFFMIDENVCFSLAKAEKKLAELKGELK